MSKIQDFVIANNVKPKECLYHTMRSVRNSKNQRTGKIRVLAMPDNVARVEYTCPECLHEAYTETEWKRPFYVKCEKCGFKISVQKMKQEFKKEQKAEQKAKKAGKK